MGKLNSSQVKTRYLVSRFSPIFKECDYVRLGFCGIKRCYSTFRNESAEKTAEREWEGGSVCAGQGVSSPGGRSLRLGAGRAAAPDQAASLGRLGFEPRTPWDSLDGMSYPWSRKYPPPSMVNRCGSLQSSTCCWDFQKWGKLCGIFIVFLVVK